MEHEAFATEQEADGEVTLLAVSALWWFTLHSVHTSVFTFSTRPACELRRAYLAAALPRAGVGPGTVVLGRCLSGQHRTS